MFTIRLFKKSLLIFTSILVGIIGAWPTAKDVDDKLNTPGEAFYLVEAGDSRNRNKLVGVHLGHEVSVVR